MMGTPLVPIMIFGWIPFVGVLFAMTMPHRAALIAFLAGWLLMPEAVYTFTGVPDLSKYTVISASVLLWMVLLDFKRIRMFSPSLIDLPMLIWCVCPLFSAVSNGHGMYDGFSVIFTQMMFWGIPYFVGRVYFSNLAAMRELMIGLFIAGVLWVPLILVELRMSPQLHRWVYGFHATQFVHTLRYGGFRPTGFVRGGLAFGLFVATAMIAGLTLWRSGSLRYWWALPTWSYVLLLAAILVLCKSKGALLLALATAGAYLLVVKMRWRWVLMVMALSVPIYLYGRVAMRYEARAIVDAAYEYVDEHRASSLEFRLYNENLLRDKAVDRPWLGWGGFGNSRIYDEEGTDISVTDSLWIIIFGMYGLIGLVSLFTVLLMPLVQMAWYVPGRLWTHPMVAPAIGAGLTLWMYDMDRLVNAQPNMIVVVLLGGLATMPWKLIVANIQHANLDGHSLNKPHRAADSPPGLARPEPNLSRS